MLQRLSLARDRKVPEEEVATLDELQSNKSMLSHHANQVALTIIIVQRILAIRST